MIFLTKEILARRLAEIVSRGMPSIRRTGRRREIAQRIRRKRIDLGISQEAAAKQLGVDRVIWSSIELGKQSVPAERLVDIARIVNATADELLGLKAAA